MHPFAHLKTITAHRWRVIANCFRAGIPMQGLLHDLSKYAPVEFMNGARHYQGYRSPNDHEREEKGYSAAWLHHKGRNRHHFEYWVDYNAATRRIEPVPMPAKYVAEMFCDRLAASKTYNGAAYTDRHPLEYFLKAKGVRMIHPKTSDEIEGLLRILAEEGEEAAFAAVRRMIKEARS